MKKSKLTETQVISMLNEAESGKPVSDLCRDDIATFTSLLNGRVSLLENQPDAKLATKETQKPS